MSYPIRRPGIVRAVSGLLLVTGVELYAVPVITATKDDNIPAATRLVGGNTIDYSITISNAPGGTTAAGVTFTDPTPAGTALVAGSVNVSPLAVDEAYTAVGNTLLRVGGTAGTGPEKFVAGGSVISNDGEFLSDSFTVTPIINGASAQGGTVNLAADGTFTYLPATGFEGADTFTYVIRDDGTDGTPGNADDLTATGTVTITVGGMVWYVNAAASAGGTGRSNAPLQSLTALTAGGADPDDPGDTIFLYEGSYSGGITLEASQRLIGRGSNLVVGADTLFTGSSAQTPTLSHNAGSTVALSAGNTVSGLHLSNSNGNGISGSAVGTLALVDVDVTLTSTNNTHTALSLTTSGTVTATGAANFLSSVCGPALNVANVGIGADGLNFKSITAGNNTAAADPANGIVLNNTGTAGGLTVTGDGGGANNGSGGTIQNTTASGILLTGTGKVSLGYLNISNCREDGIEGSSVTDLNLTRSTLTASGDDSEDCGIKVANLLGTCAWTNLSVTQSRLANVFVENTSGALTSFTITNGTYGNLAAGGGNSILINIMGSATLGSGGISGATISNNGTARGLTLQSQGTAAVGSTGGQAFVVQNNAFSANGLHASFEQGGSAGLSFRFVSNGTAAAPLVTSQEQAVNVFTSSQATGGTLYGKITGNYIGNAGVAGSGSTNAGGILATFQGQTATQLQIDGNTIRQTNGDSRGINLAYRGPANPLAGSLGANTVAHHLTLTNNVVTPGAAPSGFPLAAIMVEADNQTLADNKSPRVNADIRGNTVPTTEVYDFFSAQLGFYEYDGSGSTGIGTLFRSLPGSANATAQLQSTNTGTSEASAGVALTTTAVTVPPLFFEAAPLDLGAVIPRVPAFPDSAGEPLVPEFPLPAGDGQLREADIGPLVQASLARWQRSGLTPEQWEHLQQVKFTVSDMPGLYLGQADGRHITLDANAAGNGWFIDASPAADSEFTGEGTRLMAPAGSPAAGRVDALTTILHELGHAAGLDDLYSTTDRDSLMYGFLHLSERRLPRAAQAAGVVPHLPEKDEPPHYLAAPITIGTLPNGKSVTIVYKVTVNAGITSPAVSNQGTVSGTGFTDVLTDDPNAAGAANATVTVIEVPPVVSTVAVSKNEDTVLTFTAANFTGSYTDANSDALASIRIMSLPVNGVLKLGVTAVTLNQDITAAALGTLNYTPNTNYNGADTFNWKASDGTLLSLAAAAVNITVTSVNDNPVAGADTLQRYPTQSVKVAKSVLISNDTDIDGGTVSFTGVTSPTANGGSVTTDTKTVFYTPAAGYKGADSFTYTISDGQGGTATGTVSIGLVTDNTEGMNIAKLEPQPDGSMKVGLVGIPGRTYQIQSSENLTTWANRGNVTADARGVFSFTDPAPLPPTRYYRSVQP
ncbi:MAG: cadherin-like domain-containing protein [Verrucomicrobiota bacterium]